MEIKINDEVRKVEQSLSLSELLKVENLPEAGIAVAVNGNIIRKENRDTFILAEGDDVVIIRAAYGG